MKPTEPHLRAALSTLKFNSFTEQQAEGIIEAWGQLDEGKETARTIKKNERFMAALPYVIVAIFSTFIAFATGLTVGINRGRAQSEAIITKP